MIFTIYSEMFRTKKSIIFIISFLFLISFSFSAFPEGSKELNFSVTGNNPNIVFYLCNDRINHCNPAPYNGNRTQFAVYNCDEYERLYFVTLNSDEIVYMGFKGNTNISFRIKQNITGTPIVFTEQSLPSTVQTGYISTLPQAKVGPTQIPGNTGGYDALEFSPHTAGTYFIEFNRNNATTNFELTLLDITIYDPTISLVKPGRLYSQAWQWSGNGYSGSNYVYTTDSIITSATFNNLQGGVWVQFCNISGCGPITGNNFNQTQKSVPNLNTYYPQYKIFLNSPDPDNALFPPAVVLGSINNTPPDNPYGVQNCDGHIVFHFKVNKSGSAEVQLSFPAPYQPVKVPGNVLYGWNTIEWDGNDGSLTPVPVPNNIPITISITYQNGLTNLPLFDVETNNNGFQISLVAPTGANPEIFYNDVLINGSAIQTCPPSTSCHQWGNNVGNLNTMNTWWYSSSITQALPVMNEWRSPLALTFVGNALSVCAGPPGHYIEVVADPNTEEYHWEYTGTGGTFIPSNTTTTPNVTLNLASSATSGSVKVWGTNFNCTSIPGPSTYLTVTVKPSPDVVATPASPLTICNNTAAVIDLNSTVGGTINNTTFNWSALANNPSNVNPSNPSGSSLSQISQIFSNLVTAPEGVVFVITPVSNGCTGEAFSYLVNVNPTPNVNFTPSSSQEICSGSASPIINMSSNVLTGIGYDWTVTCNPLFISNCPPAGSASLFPVIPSASPVNLTNQVQDVVFHVTASMAASGNQLCYGPPSDFIIPVDTLVDPILPAFPAYCLNTQAFPLDTGTPLGGTYTLAGNPITLFNPAVLGIGVYPITYTVVDGNGCIGSDEKDITVQGLITPSLFGNSTACLGVSEAFITDPGKDPASYQWSVAPDGNLQPGANPWVASITWSSISPPEKTITVTYTDPNSGCTTSTTTKTITVNPLPTPAIDATGNFNACFSKAYVYTTQAGKTNYSWNVSPGNTISFTDYTATVTWNVIGSEWIEVNYSNANGCTATSPTRVAVVVNPSPVYVMAGASSVCAGSTTIYSLPAPATGNWSMPSGGSFTTPANNVNSVSVSWASGTSPAQSSITVNYTNALGCDGTTTTTVDIQPLPVTTFTTPTPSPVCQDFPTPSMYTVDPGGAAASYQWQVTPASNASIADPAANPASITWKLTGNAAQTALLTLTATTSGTVPACSATSNPVSMLINPKPNTQLKSCFDPVTTLNAKPFLLKGGTPLGSGGKYYVDGIMVAGNLLDPSGLSQNNHTISFVYTDVNGCQASGNKTIAVYPSNAGYSCMNNTFTDPRNTDPSTNTYPTTLVTANGRTACWMVKNLNWGIATPSDQPQTDNCVNQKYCLSTDDAKCTAYGGLYQWDELIQYGQTQAPYQGLCPPAWHIPTALEWQDLIDAVANMSPGDGIAGDYLKISIGFNALAEGVLYQNSSWAYTAGTPSSTMFWTSTLSGTKPIARGRNSVDPSVSIYESSKANAFPVRCVKD